MPMTDSPPLRGGVAAPKAQTGWSVWRNVSADLTTPALRASPPLRGGECLHHYNESHQAGCSSTGSYNRHRRPRQQHQTGSSRRRLSGAGKPRIQDLLSTGYHNLVSLLLGYAGAAAWRISGDAREPGYPRHILRSRRVWQWTVDSRYRCGCDSPECQDHQRFERYHTSLKLG